MREILSVCLRFLDFVEDPCRPMKREVLIDLCDLTRTTGKATATALTESLKKHKIDSGAPRARKARAERSTMGKKIW